MTSREWFCLLVGWLIGSFGLVSAFFNLVGAVLGVIVLMVVGGVVIAHSHDIGKHVVDYLKARRFAPGPEEEAPVTDFDRARRTATTLRSPRARR